MIPWIIRLSSMALILAGVALAAGGRGDCDRASDRGAADARARCLELLRAEEFAEALEVAEGALEWSPDDPGLLDAASRAANALDRRDLSLWYAERALDASCEGREYKTLRRELEARIEALDPLGASGAQAIDRALRELYELGRNCARRKLYVNAVDLLRACLGTRLDARVRAELDRILNNPKALDALRESGVDVPMRLADPKRAARIARLDAKHRAWADAYEEKTRNYTVVTNMGIETAERIATAMEQMNRFYREVFQHKRKGGGTARCTIKVYASREEFDRCEPGHEKSVKGFYSPSENLVATYDPRSEGRPLSFLWATLFHEASHQFTRMVSTGVIPGWLNEGTAAYFEGAELLPTGRIRPNGIPAGRLRALQHTLETGSPSLEEVVRYFEDGSYPASYYPVGWGLVYFMHNYEDEDCERVYLPVYREYLQSYRSGGKHDPFERFVDYFVQEADQPGIASFQDFEARFAKWILDLAAVHFGPPERADDLLAQARRRRDHGHLERAVESYTRALDKRPNDAVALIELGRVFEQLGNDDAALYSFRRALRVDAGGDRVEEALAGIRSVDALLADRLARAMEGVAATAREVALRYAEVGFPRRAHGLLRDAIAVIGGDEDLDALRKSILEESGVDLRCWRRIEAPEDLKPAAGTWRVTRDGLVGASDRYLHAIVLASDLPRRVRFEARVSVNSVGENAYLGLVCTSDGEEPGFRFGLSGSGKPVVVRSDDGDGNTAIGLPTVSIGKPKDVLMAVERYEDRVDLFLDGRLVGRQRIGPGEGGGVGLYVQQAEVVFSGLRVLY